MVDLLTVSSRRALLDTAVQLAGRLVNFIPGLVATAIVARTLHVHGYGQWSAIFVLTQIIGYAGDLGFEQAAVRFAATEAQEQRSLRWLSALGSMRATIAPVLALACIVAQLVLYTGHEMRIAGAVIALTLLLSPLSVSRLVFQLRVRNDLAVLGLTINSLLWLAGAAVAATSGSSLVAFAVAFAVTAAIGSAAQLGLALRLVTLRLQGTRSLWRPILRLGVPLGLAGLLVTAYERLDLLLLYAIRGAHEAGTYGAAYRLLDAAQFLPIAIMTTLYPMIAAAGARDPARLIRLVQIGMEYLLLGSLPALSFVALSAGDLVPLVYGPAFAAAGSMLAVLMIAFVLSNVGYLVANLLIVLEQQRRMAIFAAAALMVNVVANLLVIPSYGGLGAAWATVGTEMFVLVVSTRALIARSAVFSLRWGRITRILIAGLVSAAATLIAQAVGAPLIIVAVASLGFYLLSLRSFGLFGGLGA